MTVRGASDLDVVRKFYETLRGESLLDLMRFLHPQCRAHLTDGLPNGFGGVYEGPRAMVGEMWARLRKAYAMHPEPEEFLVEAEGRIVVVGRYVGHGIATGRPLDAAFVHILRLSEGRVVELRQITDSRRWAEALGEG